MSEVEAAAKPSVSMDPVITMETESMALDIDRQENDAAAAEEPLADDDDVDNNDGEEGEKDKDDASDSGKESVASDESSFHASDYENDSGYDPDKDVTELVSTAAEYKETGNDYYKHGDLVRASRSYKKGVSILKPLQSDENHAHDERVKSLMVTLSNNLSMLCLQQGKPKLSVDVASKAIAVDGTNAKSYYRRAMGYKKLGLLKEAKQDLKVAYQCDPTNKTVQKELHSIVKYLHDTHQRQKKAAQAVFSFDKKSTSLYDDKHEEEERKKEEQERKKREEEELLAQRKREWEEDCAQKRRMAQESGGDGDGSATQILSFEEWDKQRKKKEKADRKAKKQEERRLLAEEKRKAEEKVKMEQAAKKKKEEERRKAEADEDDDDDDEKLTESELSQFRGYKKTRNGTVTSYFHREASEHDMKIIGDITPQRLDENGELIGPSGPAKLSMSKDATSSAPQQGKGKASAWNAGGVTWEEKDATEWARSQLRLRLLETTAALATKESLVGTITTVPNLLGDASVAVAGGRKRYIFDFHGDVEFEINDGMDHVVAAGSIRLPDVNSANYTDFEIEVGAWKVTPSLEFQVQAVAVRADLFKAVRVSVQDFVNDFNGHY
ncbi:activator of Hsp90 ATPase [Fragilaria crotonensis]|nr:activator of Hsp90 ATPase [Fragilaria crotonensis]